MVPSGARTESECVILEVLCQTATEAKRAANPCRYGLRAYHQKEGVSMLEGIHCDPASSDDPECAVRAAFGEEMVDPLLRAMAATISGQKNEGICSRILCQQNTADIHDSMENRVRDRSTDKRVQSAVIPGEI